LQSRFPNPNPLPPTCLEASICQVAGNLPVGAAIPVVFVNLIDVKTITQNLLSFACYSENDSSSNYIL
jgi:hypothetical protein